MSGEQTFDQTTAQPRTPPDGYGTWKEYWTKEHDQPWRTDPEIEEERQQYLTGRRAIIPDIDRGIYPFKDIETKLTRADIEWLLATHRHSGKVGPVHWEDEKAKDFDQGRQGLDLRGADLRGTDLSRLPLVRLIASLSTQEWTDQSSNSTLRQMAAAHMEGAKLSRAHLEGASLRGVHLEGADLQRVHLERAGLTAAHLAGANLLLSYLQGTYFGSAHFEGKLMPPEDLAKIRMCVPDFPETLPGANLRVADLDRSSALFNATLGHPKYGSFSVADVNWGDINLARTDDWPNVRKLGDEQTARQRLNSTGKPKASRTRLTQYQRATRANRQLAVVLRSQGMNEYSDRFAYRAQLCQRVLLRRQRHYLRYLGSSILWLVAGYGYRPLRSFITYLLVVGAFAITYYLLSNNVHPPLDPLGAIVFSITSFHGRGFTPGENVAITNPLTVVAAGEAIIGLLIEIVFIATFTQRFFAR